MTTKLVYTEVDDQMPRILRRELRKLDNNRFAVNKWGPSTSAHAFDFGDYVGDYHYNPTDAIPDEEEVQAAIRFLKGCIPCGKCHLRKHWREYSYSYALQLPESYGLKHTIERWSRQQGGVTHVGNGETIEAARRLGLSIWHIIGCQNCLIGITQESVYEVAGYNEEVRA